ncbi:hypothetical protein F5X68DRAFT_5532 [Plectosphaerella plurivora]|uniref:Chitin-binding type-4 domain-containing protein n=1 Tax=Plectosphaerella plurivora TaxID=936078 RepID=A0A9P8VL33_9PEZI|nr:hypothetical protein F5X68DRAFT_5532 [Plectosphaerella plurivora]
MAAKLISVLSFAAAVSAHGRVLSPTPRAPGPAFEAACGSRMFNTMNSDPNGNIQGLEQGRDASLDPADCFLPLCGAYPFADNAANVQSYAAGEVVPFEVMIAAPHTGVANVSIVNTATNTILGAPLIEFENYASTRTGVAANNTAFSVTLPESISGADCSVAGNCVLQWWWDSDEASQTYMSCVDFTFGGASGGGSAPAPAPPAASSAAPAPVQSSAAPVAPVQSSAPVDSAAPAPTFSTVVPDVPAPTATGGASPQPTAPSTCTRRRVRRNSPEAKRYHAKRAAALAARR